jgi:cobalt-zinc-cadmium efflux system outer membrane protein
MEQVDIDKHIVTMDLAASTAKQFTQILVKQERLKLNQMATLQANEVLKAISERVSAGRSSTIEMRMAEVEIVRMQLAVEDTEHDLKASQYQLSSLWGKPGTQFRVNGNLFALPVLSSLDKELDKLKKSPYITQFATATRIAQSQLELARIEAKSQWQFSAGFRRYEATDDFGLVAGVSVPFGASDRNAGTISTLQAKQDVLAVEQVALMQKLDSQLYVQLQEIAHARHVIDAFEKTIIPTLEVTLKEAVRAFELGQLSYSQWSDIRRDLLNAQSELLNTYESLHLQHIEIQRLTGASISL